jgi:hypothetical protein
MKDLWSFRSDSNSELIEKYLYLVFQENKTAALSKNDWSTAYLSLVECINKFDPQKGIPFEVYFFWSVSKRIKDDKRYEKDFYDRITSHKRRKLIEEDDEYKTTGYRKDSQSCRDQVLDEIKRYHRFDTPLDLNYFDNELKTFIQMRIENCSREEIQRRLELTYGQYFLRLQTIKNVLKNKYSEYADIIYQPRNQN